MDTVHSLQQQHQQQQQQQQQQPTTTTTTTTTATSKPATGTISGMLADFSKALGESNHIIKL